MTKQHSDKSLFYCSFSQSSAHGECEFCDSILISYALGFKEGTFKGQGNEDSYAVG